MPKLRQTTTGEIYPFMSGLAARPDMELIEDDVPSTDAHEEAIEAKKRGPKAKKPATDIEFTVADVPPADVASLFDNE